MSFPRYPTYKNTVTDWLGEVPEHWSVNRFKLSVESCTNGVWGEEASNDENDVTCIRVADFDRHRLEARDPDELTIRNVSDRDIEQRSLRKGDLLIEKSGGGEKQPVGAVVLYIGTPPAVCSNFVARMRLKRGQSPSFWRYAHHAAYSLRVNTKSIKQTSGIQNLDQQQYLDESAAYPSLDEQLAIGNFLDRETAKIDALSAEQQRLIELLQEKRQAVISHAVTKGLNPNAPMKDSGVEWLGEVPEHWEVKPLKHLTRQISVGVVVEPSKYYDDQGTVPALRSLNIKAGEIQMDDCVYITEESNEILKKSRLCAGDLVVVRTGQPGTCAVIPDELDNCNCIDLIFIRKPRDGDSTYLMLSLSSDSSRYQYAAGAEGAIQQHFNVKTASELVVPWPPEEEQSQIRDWLMRKTSDVDRLTSIAVQSIELLEERRSALISAAVTGQIDVRGLTEAAAEEL